MLLCKILLTCIVLITYIIPRIEARFCMRDIYGAVPITHYQRRSSHYTTGCGFLGLGRCRRTRYSRTSFQVYQRQRIRIQTECCDGYTMSGSTCMPICDASCVSPRYCREPNICQCTDSRYSGVNCNTPVCSNCPSPRVCLAPEICQCIPGYTGTNCNEDIDECGVLATDPVCEQLCINTRGSYSCACHEDFVMGNDGIRCIGTVNASFATINSSVLLAKWRHPEWDRENITVAYNITCSNGVNSSVLLNAASAGHNVQLSLDLSTEGGYKCCIIVITSNGNGPPSCINGSSPEVTTISIMTDTSTDTMTVGDQSQRGNRSIEAPPSILESDEFKIGVGAAGGCLALLIIMAVLLLLCCCRCYHRKKTSAQEMINLPVQNDHKGVDNYTYASEKLQKSSRDYEIPVPFQSDHSYSKKPPDIGDSIYTEIQPRQGDSIMMSQCSAYGSQSSASYLAD